jgi:hypothetical protein
MAKRKMTKGHTTTYKTLHIKLKIECIFLLLEISKMIALFHLAIVLSVVLFTALVSTNVFWVNVALIIRRYCVNDLQSITHKTKDRVTRTPLKPRGWTICSQRSNELITIPRSLVVQSFIITIACTQYRRIMLITTLASSNSFLWTHNPCVGEMVSFKLFNDAYNY